MLNDFIAVVLDSKGNISSKRFNKPFFIKQNKEYLWEWFEEISLNFPEYSNREIILLLQNEILEPPKCVVCGNNAKVQIYAGKSNISFDYCSKKCSEQSSIIKQKISKSKLSLSDEQKQKIEEKRKQTNLEKYGVQYQSQREEIKKIISDKTTKRYLNNDVIYKLNDEEWLHNEYVIKKRDAIDIADELGVYYGTVIDYCKKFNFKIRRTSKNSKPQKEIFEYIKSIYSDEVLYDDWTVLGNKQLDIYVPALNLAFEHNGLLHHSFVERSTKAKLKHIDKTNRCEKLNIRLIHIRGDHWQKQKDLVKSMIKNAMGLTDEKIYARKCSIKKVSVADCREFLKNNHLQGFCGSSVKLGLFYNGELVSLMMFGTPRYNKNYKWELLRFCSKKYTNVIGGFSKLLSYFRKNYNGTIISYCDRSISNGNVYIKNGFVSLIEIDKIEPGYSWTNRHLVYSREKFEKYKLRELYKNNQLKFYDESLSEYFNMIKNGYRIIYDSGQIPFVLE